MVDVFAFVVEVLEALEDGAWNDADDGIDILHDGDGLAHHHEGAEISAHPLCGSDDIASDRVVGEDVGEYHEGHVADNLLDELLPEVLAGCIAVDDVLGDAEEGVDDDRHTYPLGELPVLVEVAGEVGKEGEGHGHQRDERKALHVSFFSKDKGKDVVGKGHKKAPPKRGGCLFSERSLEGGCLPTRCLVGDSLVGHACDATFEVVLQLGD